MKIIAFYLPQFHTIPENDEWWGKDFTEWVNVKKAEPVFKGHYQPNIPLNNNYYNLLDDDVKLWQSKLAKKYGIYGFCYYHYWFNGHLLLEKPMEQMLMNKDISTPFCICWANETWTKAWVGEERKVLIKQTYGNKKEWKEHFDYLLPFFKDERYIKEDGKPLMIIYRPHIINCLNEMVEYWRELATDNGLPGLVVASQSLEPQIERMDMDRSFDKYIEFQPSLSRSDLSDKNNKFMHLKKCRRHAATFIEKRIGIDILRYGQSTLSKLNNLSMISYDDAWNVILNRKPINEKNVPGAFVKWDNSPRFGKRARIFVGETPQKFQKYLSTQIKRTRDVYHKDMLFLYAWNEWAEGGYLEPDERNEYSYLEAIRNALEENNELPL